MERTQFGKYSVVARIGQGAMGDVFKAHDAILDRYVALKTIAASLGSSPDARLRFHREAQSIARLNHPNIVTVYDFGEEEGEVYMAMEFLEGANLRSLIAEKRLTALDDTLALMEQVCEGVGFAHSMSVVHRDLKPANIQVLTDGRVKVMDFGLARIGAASGMTQTGTVLGTPHYMSPEQVKGQRSDPRSDVFALGAILYEVLTGHQPFEAESMHAVLFRILESEPEPLRRWYPEAPAPVVALAARALSKDPEQRFADGARMAAVVRAVRAELSGEGSKPPGSLVTLLAAEESEATHAFSAPAAAIRGNLALEALVASDARAPEAAETRRGEPTLSGKAPTRPGPSSGRPSSGAAETAAGGRGWALVAAGLVVIVGAGLVAWGMLRPGDDAPAPVAVAGGPSAAQTELEQQLLAAERTLAQEALQDREYDEALDHAGRALGVQPDDAEALRVREAARRALDSANVAAAGARGALAQGDTTTAARRLEELLEIQPGHPDVAELTNELAAAAPTRQPPPTRVATTPKTPAAAAPPPAEAPRKTTPQPTPPPKEAAPVSEPVSAAPPPAVSAPPPAVSAPPPRLRPAAVVTRPASSSPRATAPPPKAAPPEPDPAPPPGPSDETLIREVVGEYGRAIATKDLGLFRRVKPNLSGDEEQRLREAFEVGEQEVSIEITSVEVTGESARVRLVRRDTIGGKALRPFEQVLSLRRGPRGWTVESIGR